MTNLFLFNPTSSLSLARKEHGELNYFSFVISRSPDSIYTPDDVQFIIQYARLRGIVVVPGKSPFSSTINFISEFDMPAHANR